MRLDDVAALHELKVAGFAEAAARGTDDVRALIAPISTVLYTYIARRTEDPEEAEDLLVETLLRARSDSYSGAIAGTPLPGWLLSLAQQALETEVESNQLHDAPWERALLSAGLKPNDVVPAAESPSWMLQTIARLPHDERSALGMRFGDSLPPDVIGQVLGISAGAAQSAVDRAVRCVQESCCPDKCLSRITPTALAGYVSDLLAGVGHSTPPEVGPGLKLLLDSLVAMRSTRALAPSREVRVWRRYEEEREEALQGRTAPAWVWSIVLVALLLVALIAASVWVLSRQPDDPVRIAGASGSASGRTGRGASGRPEVAHSSLLLDPISPPDTSTEVASASFPARLYYEQTEGNRGTRLMSIDMAESLPSGVHPSRTVLAQPYGELYYVVSPSDAGIAYSVGDSLWMQDLDGREKQNLLTLQPGGWRGGGAPKASWYPVPLRVGPVAWRPRGDRIALIAGPANPRDIWPVQLLVVDLDGKIVETVDVSQLTSTVAPTADHSITVRDLTWSPAGEQLLVGATGVSLLLDMSKDPPCVKAVLPALKSAAWSMAPRSQRLLWIGQERPDGNSTLGVYNARDARLEFMGEAVSAAWYPGGRSIVFARYAKHLRNPLDVWILDPTTREQRRVAGLPGMPVPSGGIQFAPDGQHLAYATPEGIYLADYTTRELGKLEGSEDGATALRWEHSLADYVVQPVQAGVSGYRPVRGTDRTRCAATDGSQPGYVVPERARPRQQPGIRSARDRRPGRLDHRCSCRVASSQCIGPGDRRASRADTCR